MEPAIEILKRLSLKLTATGFAAIYVSLFAAVALIAIFASDRTIAFFSIIALIALGMAIAVPAAIAHIESSNSDRHKQQDEASGRNDGPNNPH